MDWYEGFIEIIAPNTHFVVYAIPPAAAFLVTNMVIVEAIFNKTNGAIKEWEAGYFTPTEMLHLKE